MWVEKSLGEKNKAWKIFGFKFFQPIFLSFVWSKSFRSKFFWHHKNLWLKNCLAQKTIWVKISLDPKKLDQRFWAWTFLSLKYVWAQIFFGPTTFFRLFFWPQNKFWAHISFEPKKLSCGKICDRWWEINII